MPAVHQLPVIQRRAVCAAVPAGIPKEILDGKNDYRQSYPGDGRVQYSPNESQRRYLAEFAEKRPEQGARLNGTELCGPGPYVTCWVEQIRFTRVTVSTGDGIPISVAEYGLWMREA